MLFNRDGLMTFHGWTHSVLDLLIDHSRSLPRSALETSVEGFGHDTLRQQFVHVLFTEETWIRALQSLEYRRWTNPPSTLEDIVRVKQEVIRGTAAYVRSLDDAALNRELAVVPDYWVGPKRSPAFICHHVLTHAFHHKGQIGAMLRFLGYPLPDSDMQRQE